MVEYKNKYLKYKNKYINLKKNMVVQIIYVKNIY